MSLSRLPRVPLGILALLLAGAVHAQEQRAVPEDYLQGPGHLNESIERTGVILGFQPGRWLVLLDASAPGLGGGGRVWVLESSPARHPWTLNEPVRLSGQVVGTQMTRVGPAWRPVPVVSGALRPMH